jgi:ArsR family transcriptional regulator, virulence genes transcriptional regulator
MKPDLSPEIQELAERQAALCRVFGNPQRVLILWLLAERERTVTEIALAIGASMQSTSQHLRIMEFRNIVESRREHHNIYYHIANNELLQDCLILANRPKDKLLEISPI